MTPGAGNRDLFYHARLVYSGSGYGRLVLLELIPPIENIPRKNQDKNEKRQGQVPTPEKILCIKNNKMLNYHVLIYWFGRRKNPDAAARFT